MKMARETISDEEVTWFTGSQKKQSLLLNRIYC